MASCLNCFQKDTFLVVSAKFNNKNYTYKFCQYCEDIFLYEKGFFGTKNKPFGRSSLSRVAGNANMLRDTLFPNEEYEDIISNRSQVPPILVNIFFNQGFLIIDNLGVRTKEYEYFYLKKFYTNCTKEDIRNDRIKERHKEMEKNIRDFDRIKTGQFKENELAWVGIHQ